MADDQHVKGAIIVGAFSIIGILLTWYLYSGSQRSDSNPTPGLRKTLQPIRILPVADPVARCSSLEGTGDVPSGKKLWIVVVTSQDGRPKYYFDDTSAGAGKWSAPRVSIGSADEPVDTQFTVDAVLFDDATSDMIASGAYRDGVDKLPPGAATQDETVVKLGQDRRPC